MPSTSKRRSRGWASSQHPAAVSQLQGPDRQRQGRSTGPCWPRAKAMTHRRQRPQPLRHPRRPAGRPAGQRRDHHRDRQVRGRRRAPTAPCNFWNMARQVDAVCNELGITVPVAVHADHYGIKGPADVAQAPRSRSPPCSTRASPPSPSTPPTCRTTRTCWPASALNQLVPGLGWPGDRGGRDQGQTRACPPPTRRCS